MAEQQAWAKAHYELLTETGERVGVTVSGNHARYVLRATIAASQEALT